MRISDWSSDVCSSDLMNEAIHEARGLGVYIERGREWLHEMGDRLRERAELAAQGMASFVQGAARTMRAGLQTSTGDGFEAVPALDHSPRSEQTPGIELDQPAQAERDRQRTQERERQRERRVGKECVSTGRSRWAPYH